MYKKLIIIVIIIILIYININTTNEKFSNSINKIPKIIIQTWKEENIPLKYYKDIKSLMENNKDYEYIFFTDNNIEKFLEDNYSEYYKTYKKLPFKIQKIDFFSKIGS